MTKKYISALKRNFLEEASLEFRFYKLVVPRNYILDEIQHNDVMSEKHKKTCGYLNFEVLLILD